MKIFAALLTISFLIGSISFAKKNITLKCEVAVQGERTTDISKPTITFDADKEFKNLSFKVYGSEVSVSASSYMAEDGKTCGILVNQICVGLKGSGFCTTQPEATMYPRNKFAQAGDSASIVCKIQGGEAEPCALEN